MDSDLNQPSETNRPDDLASFYRRYGLNDFLVAADFTPSDEKELSKRLRDAQINTGDISDAVVLLTFQTPFFSWPEYSASQPKTTFVDTVHLPKNCTPIFSFTNIRTVKQTGQQSVGADGVSSYPIYYFTDKPRFTVDTSVNTSISSKIADYQYGVDSSYNITSESNNNHGNLVKSLQPGANYYCYVNNLVSGFGSGSFANGNGQITHIILVKLI